MPGQFSKANRPKRPGSYFNWIGSPREVLPAATGGIVAVAFTHDWGPDESVVSITSLSEFQAVYGPSTDTEGYRAIRGVFQGEAYKDRRGASQVLCFRMTGAAGVKALKALSNTTPATSLTLTAKYTGSYGNDLRVTTQDYATDATKTELILYLGTVEVERYLYVDADVASVAAQINATSDWVTATANVTGVALAPVSSQAFASGADGAAILAADYTSWMAALDGERFGYLVAANLTDNSIITAIRSWAITHNANGKRFTAVFGGLSDETITTAVTRAQLLANWDCVTLGMGHFVDTGNGNVVLSTAEAAPRWAGILSARGEAAGATFARMSGYELVNGPSQADILKAFDAGIVVFGRDSNPDAPVRAERSLTTYTLTTDPDVPYAVFRDPKFVATMHAVETELTEWADTNVVGLLQVNDNTRSFVRAQGRSLMKDRERLGIVQAGWSVEVDQDPPPSDDDDFIGIRIGANFGRSVEKVFWTAFVG